MCMKKVVYFLYRKGGFEVRFVAGSVTGELENLGSEVLEHGTEVHGSAGADARGVLALLQVAMHATDGELESRLLGAGDGLAALGFAAFVCLA